MPVNRIYFRGIKTFQGGFVFFAIWLPLVGCGGIGKIQIRTQPVASSPRIVDIQVSGACPRGKVFLQSPSNDSEVRLTQIQQLPTKQAENTLFQRRFTLPNSENTPAEPRVNLRLSVRCPDHSERVIEHPIPRDLFDNLSTPDWAKGLVWYQVFPERFRDGNPNNNPNSWDLTPTDWSIGFDDPQFDEIERAWNRRLVDPRKYPYDQNRAGGAAASLIFDRRFGGDLMGVYDQLESLKTQGFTGIYLCPVFQSRSLHKYDADDHRHIDPTLGNPGDYQDPGPGHTLLGANEDPSDESTWAWTPSDRWFVEVFLPKAKSLGFRVVLDGVWNHVGTDHFAFTDVQRNGRDSPFADWFQSEFDEQGNLIAWQGWGGRVNGNLPEFVQTATGDLAPGPKAHVMAVTRRWMDPNGDGDPADGIDGWRLDVAGEIGKPFWKDWREQVRELNPDALIIGEIWSDADDMLNDEAFDGQMNYPFAYAIAEWLSIGHTKGDATIAAKRLTSVFHHAPEHDLVQFNLMTSHDTERLASLMHNDFVRGYDQGAARWARGTRYESDRIEQHDMDRALAAIAAMVASPGAMMIYNGDEYALPGADDPDNRRPIPWNTVEPSPGSDDSQLMDSRIAFNRVVSALLGLRSDPGFARVLRFGDAEFIGIQGDGMGGALLIRRSLGDQMVEFLIPSNPGRVDPASMWPSPQPGWSIDRERSRKFGMEGSLPPIVVRCLIVVSARE